MIVQGGLILLRYPYTRVVLKPYWGWFLSNLRYLLLLGCDRLLGRIPLLLLFLLSPSATPQWALRLHCLPPLSYPPPWNHLDRQPHLNTANFNLLFHRLHWFLHEIEFGCILNLLPLLHLPSIRLVIDHQALQILVVVAVHDFCKQHKIKSIITSPCLLKKGGDIKILTT